MKNARDIFTEVILTNLTILPMISNPIMLFIIQLFPKIIQNVIIDTAMTTAIISLT